MNSIELWNSVKAKLKSEYDQDTYESYFEPIVSVYKETDSTIYLIVENMFVKTRIQNSFLSKMNKLLSDTCALNRYFALITKDEISNKEREREKELDNLNFSRINASGLNPNYTFSTFIVGDSNRFAHRYATLAADQLAGIANPIYIFGDVGLGKTHLMQAIGNYVLENKPELKVLYVRTQDFVEEYAKASKTGYENFSDKFSRVDILLVDDVQFLEQKPKSQIEFFKIFEKLSGDKKLIVLTSDKKASDLVEVMARLTSRFEWGISLDINKPDKAHRVSILKAKLNQECVNPSIIPDDVIDFIATICENNIRELEGALKRVLFYCEAFNYEYNIENAKEALKNITTISNMGGNSIAPTHEIKKVIDVVGTYFKIDQESLLSNSRKKELVYARQLCFYIFKTKFDLTFQKIGDIFNGKDHSTVMHGFQTIEQNVKTNEETKKNLENILRKIGKSVD